jgi:hypothetical protein
VEPETEGSQHEASSSAVTNQFAEDLHFFLLGEVLHVVVEEHGEDL